MRGAVSVVVVAHLIVGLLERAVDEAVFGIHDGGFGVDVGLLLHTAGSLVAVAEYLFGVGHLAHQFLHLLVVFQQFDGQKTGGVALADMRLLLEVLLYILDAMLYLMTVVDVDMAVVAVLILGTFVYLNDFMKQFLHAFAGFEHRGHHRHAEQLRQPVEVHIVAASLGLVKHIECHDDTQVHVHDLRGEVEVALEVGRIDDVDHYVRRLLHQLLTYIELLG